MYTARPLTWLIISACVPMSLDASSTTSDRQKLRRTPVVEVFEKTKNSVVNISTTQLVQVRSAFGRMDSMFEELFDFPVRRRRTQELKSVGSGIVLHSAGYIVTNAHVVARTVERNVIFDDQREYDAQVIATDEQHDLAVLKIDTPEPLDPIQLGQSSDLMIGETVVAIGNPLGYQHTVTVGIVSALDRKIEVGNAVVFDGLIQTDAPINPGNSGGPLLNVIGELIGVTTAIRADAQNIGFAIPVDRLRELLPAMLDVERRYRIRTGMSLLDTGEAKVRAFEAGGPADEAGVRVGDVIVQMDLQPISGLIGYHIALIGKRPGERVRMTLRRGGRDVKTSLVLDERPRPDGAALLKSKFGIEAQLMTAQMARALRIRRTNLLMVTGVERSSGQIERGDVIIQLDRYQPTSLDHVGELLDPVRRGEKVAFTVVRIAGNRMYRFTLSLTAR